MDTSFKDDVIVILLLGVSFVVAFHEAPAQRMEEAYSADSAGRLCLSHF
jgi:hypothetical protein